MSDGAHHGINAERALGTILGGEPQPEESKKMSPEQMLDRIREQSFDNLDYSGAARAYARLILEAYEAHPALQDHPTKTVYLRGQDGTLVTNGPGRPVCLQPDLYDVLKSLHAGDTVKLDLMSGLTGFMVGWAHNAVRYALGLPPVQNPALLTIGG